MIAHSSSFRSPSALELHQRIMGVFCARRPWSCGPRANSLMDLLRGEDGLGSVSGFLNIDREFLLDFRKKRAARNTRVKLLLSHDSKGEEGQNDPQLLRTFKYLPEKYRFKSTIDIYDDKIVIIGPEIKALAVVVAIPAMVDIFRSVFEILWEMTP